MPCGDHQGERGQREVCTRPNCKRTRKLLNQRADMLCRVLTKFKGVLDPDILIWWEAHKKFDKKRKSK